MALRFLTDRLLMAGRLDGFIGLAGPQLKSAPVSYYPFLQELVRGSGFMILPLVIW